MAIRPAANASGTSRIVAVDLGPRFVRVVEVEQSGDDVKMTRRGVAALPANCWNDVTANRDAMAASIREAMTAAGVTPRSVVACLPRRLVTVRFARLPQAPPEQMRGMIEFEAQQYILFPLAEVILDYHVPTGIGSGLSSSQDDLQSVLLAAARRSLIADIVAIFDRVGVELTTLSVSALALAEHVRDSLEPTAVIALESGAMDVSVVADGQLLFTRSSALEVAGIAPEVAARRFSEEVARSFTAYQNEFRQKPLAHVYLCGSETATADGDWMDQALMEALEKPVGRLHSRLLPASDPEARSYAIAAGMALQGLGSALSDINLVPNDRAEKRAQVQRTRRRQLVGLGVAAGIVGGLFLLNSALEAQKKLQKETVDANLAMDEAIKQEKPIQRAHDRVAVLDRVLTKALDRDHPSVDVLVAINRCMPKSSDIWLAQMNFDRTGLMTLRGDSKNPRAVTDLVINLQASGAFSDVRLSYIADAQDSASPGDVVRTVAPKPPVTPLPALTPTVTNPLPGMTPGSVPGAQTMPGGAGQFGGRGGFNPAGGGYNPAAGAYPGGFNPNTGGANPGGFQGRFNRGGFGNPNRFNPGGNPGGFNGGAPSATPGGVAPAGAPGTIIYSPNGGNAQATFTPGQVATTQGTQTQYVVPGQVPTAPGVQPPTLTTAPPNMVISPNGTMTTAPAPGQRMVFTPDGGSATAGQPGMTGVPGQGGFSEAQINAWRQYRNGVTGRGGPSSVNMAGIIPGAPAPVVTGAAPPATATPAVKTTRKVVTETKASKPTLTGFVITCRLRPNAKLIPPDARDTVQNNAAPERVRTSAPATVIHGATDNSDDSGDLD